MAVFLVKSYENTYPKGRALIQMYRVVPQTKRGNVLPKKGSARFLDEECSFLI